MKRRDFLVMTVGAGISCGAAPFAEAEEPGRWLRIRSTNFELFSKWPEVRVRDMSVRLEAYHRVLAQLLGKPAQSAPARPLSVYVLDSEEYDSVYGGRPGLVGGFYQASPSETVAVINIDQRADTGGRASLSIKRGQDELEWILFHEYAHHFMLQYFSGTYPRWFVEGFAEYVSTVNFKDGVTTIGLPNSNRVSWLMNEDPVDLHRMLQRDYQPQTGSEVARFYATSWLLTHWIFGDQSRSAAWPRFVSDYRDGADPLVAFESVFGVPAKRMTETLLDYGRNKVSLFRFATPAAIPAEQTTTERLPKARDRILTLGMRARIGVSKQRQNAFLAKVERQVASLPGDAFAARVLAHAQLSAGRVSEALATLAPFTASESADYEDLSLLGRAYLIRYGHTKAPEDRASARTAFTRAYRLKSDYVPTLLGLAETYWEDPSPHPNMVAALESAYTLAPQVEETTRMLCEVLLRQERFADVIWILGPILTNPHAGETDDPESETSDEAEDEVSFNDLLRRAQEGLAAQKAAQGQAPS